jgi:purine-binding chemotaxis protein CheW
VVRSGGHRCAIPVDAAKLVTQTGRIDPLPGSSPCLLGLAQIAGEPVPVVDLHALLDPEGRPGGGRALTVVVSRRRGRAALGLAVDEAFGVVVLDAELDHRDGDPGWIAGWSRLDGRAVARLDPERLLATGDERSEGGR